MRFFIDNNLAPALARGMAAFGEDVGHLQDEFAADTDDTVWLGHIGDHDIALITRDDAIRRRPAELAALRAHKVKAFFLGGKQRTRCQIVQQLVRNWPRIKHLATHTMAPFAFRVPPMGTKLDRIALD